MPPKSSIRQLPDPLRAEVDRLLADGRFSLDQVIQHLKTLGAEVSRSALGRYSQDFERVAQDIRMTREMARAVGRELSDLTDGDATTMLVESLHALLLKSRMQLADGEDISPKAVADQARAAKDLATALRIRADMEIQIEERARRKVEAEMKRRIEEARASGGFDAGTAEEALRILGFA